MITIDIEIKKRNPIKDFLYKIHGRTEDMMFFIIQRIPERFTPSPLMNWLSKYLDKRISELKQESIKMTWQNMYLQNSLTEIHTMQQDAKEASSDD